MSPPSPLTSLRCSTTSQETSATATRTCSSVRKSSRNKRLGRERRRWVLINAWEGWEELTLAWLRCLCLLRTAVLLRSRKALRCSLRREKVQFNLRTTPLNLIRNRLSTSSQKSLSLPRKTSLGKQASNLLCRHKPIKRHNKSRLYNSSLRIDSVHLQELLRCPLTTSGIIRVAGTHLWLVS